MEEIDPVILRDPRCEKTVAQIALLDSVSGVDPDFRQWLVHKLLVYQNRYVAISRDKFKAAHGVDVWDEVWDQMWRIESGYMVAQPPEGH